MESRGAAEQRHVPVLRDRIVSLLAPALLEPGSVLVDGTLGMGGHAEAFLEVCRAAGLPETTSGWPRVHPLVREPSGLRIGALVDPDGTLLRVIENPD